LPIVQAKDSAMIIFDASGSMWGQLNGTAKIEIARDVMGALVKDWNEDIEMGLMAYGHREKGNCDDIEILQVVTTVDSNNILNIIKKITPKGKTPISQSLKQAAETLRYTEDAATVILISDGEETCNADPCVVSKKLKEKGINFTTHVIGFDIKKNKTAQKQLKCIAENTGGQFFQAEDALSLKKALVKVKKAVVDSRPAQCKTYAENAVKQEQTSLEKECSYIGKHWSLDYETHFNWCMKQLIDSALPDKEHRTRLAALKECEIKKTTTVSKKVSTAKLGTLVFNLPKQRICWTVLRGNTRIESRCRQKNSTTITLKAGTYTIKPKRESVFEPFEVTIKEDETNIVNRGGVLDLRSFGKGCWTIFRGETKLMDHCDNKLLGLENGTYTIKQKDADASTTFEVTIKEDETNTTDTGGMLDLRSLGGTYTCWTIFRGETKLMDHCDNVLLVLKSGTYTVKQKNSNAFTAFEVTIKDGETNTINKGGMLDLSSLGDTCWTIFREDTKVIDHCGNQKALRLQAGEYVIKAKNDDVFESFEVTVKEGETHTVNKN